MVFPKLGVIVARRAEEKGVDAVWEGAMDPWPERRDSPGSCHRSRCCSQIDGEHRDHLRVIAHARRDHGGRKQAALRLQWERRQKLEALRVAAAAGVRVRAKVKPGFVCGGAVAMAKEKEAVRQCRLHSGCHSWIAPP